MIITLAPNAGEDVLEAVERIAMRHAGITPRRHVFEGARENITEVHLIGATRQVPTAVFEALPGVVRVVRVSTKYRLIGRHDIAVETSGFEYCGVKFDDRTVNLFAGLCAVDTLENVDAMMRALASAGLFTTRMGAYKPRTSPYDFQGLGKECLPWVFESAGKHQIRVISMEVTDARQIDEIQDALDAAGNPTGVMLQVGTRNAQNFELLKQIGQQKRFPVLFKRGMGITLEESLNACEYIASEGNPNIVFCLRGVKTHLGDPHRNLVDFGHVPVVQRLTRLPVCIDPSHSVGRRDAGPDGVPDIIHVISQGIIAGATQILVDFHPEPGVALCDGPQALRLSELSPLVAHCNQVRVAYEELGRAWKANAQTAGQS
jgi:3-deoxy-7-phosphoheptulonate synthase